MCLAAPEQPDDWTEPGAFTVEPGIFRIPLPLQDEALRAVNVYLIEDESALTLVDAGHTGVRTTSALTRALKTVGLKLSDIRRVLVTHAHHDHYSNALRLRDLHGATVHLGRGEAPSVSALVDPAASAAEQPILLRRAGAADLANEMHRIAEEYTDDPTMMLSQPDAWLDHGDQLSAGQRTLEVIATPGHTRGHVVFRDDAASILFAGDHILPHITPSIGYERRPERYPLRSYIDSLNLVGSRPDALLLPAHGPVYPSTLTRVEELLIHHERRLAEVVAGVRNGWSNAYQVAAAMPWTRRQRPLRDLGVEHACLAVLEIAAHLDLAVHVGELVVEDVEGVLTYTAAG